MESTTKSNPPRMKLDVACCLGRSIWGVKMFLGEASYPTASNLTLEQEANERKPK